MEKVQALCCNNHWQIGAYPSSNFSMGEQLCNALNYLTDARNLRFVFSLSLLWGISYFNKATPMHITKTVKTFSKASHHNSFAHSAYRCTTQCLRNFKHIAIVAFSLTFISRKVIKTP